MNFFVENIYSVIFVPFWVSLILFAGKLFAVIKSRKIVNIISLLALFYCLVLSIGVFVKTLIEKGFIYEKSFPFLTISNFNFTFGTYIDGVATWFLLLAVIISLVVQIYSCFYMKNDKSYLRFFALINLFNFGMFGLILSQSLFQMYVFWEIVGVASYLLIGFWYKNEDVSSAAKRAFIINRIGDFAFLAGIILSSYIILTNLGNISSVALPFSEMSYISAQIYGCTSDGIFILACILLLMGSIAKSAQFPLHTWLIDAMKGPTPVSALIHSATMVAAGVFLLIRLYPLYSLNNIVLTVISVVGLFTALICSYSAMTQTDIKKILAYSTNAQLGLMFLAVGSCSATVGLFHLTSHAFAKALLFLLAGAIISLMCSNRDITVAGGLRKRSPLLAFTFLMGILSLSGMLFSGFSSKEIIFSSLIENNHIIYAILFILISFMTIYYLFRMYFYIFEGEVSDIFKNQILDKGLIYVPIVLLIFVVLLWFVFPKSENNLLVVINYIIGAIAIASSYFCYKFRAKIKKLPIMYQCSYSGFCSEYINSKVVFIYNKIFELANKAEQFLFDGIVFSSSFAIRLFAWLFSKMQTGNVQSYLAYSMIVLIMGFGGVMFVYSLIIYFSEVQ